MVKKNAILFVIFTTSILFMMHVSFATKVDEKEIDKFLNKPILFPKLSSRKRVLSSLDKKTIQHKADNVFASGMQIVLPINLVHLIW